MRTRLFLCALFLLLSAAAFAQDDECGTVPQEAFDLTTERCADTGMNQLCYGYAQLDVELQPDADPFRFESPGDRIDIAAVRSLQSSPMNLEESLWGVGVMRLQADLEGTMPGQAVTFLLFGDTRLDAADNPTESNMLHAFYFQSGIGDSRCQEAPHSGILISTPQGVGQINLVLNQVEIALGSTAFLQAEPGGDLTVNMLEGRAEVTAEGETQAALMNMRIRVPLDENLAPVGPPSPPEACNVDDMRSLPYERQMNCEEVWINLDDSCPSRVFVPHGLRINISNGYGYSDEAQAHADYEAYQPTISVDGEVVVDEVGSIQEFVPGSWWVFGQNYFWGEPEPGDYVVTGDGPHGSHMGRGDTRMCEITVMPPLE